MGDVEPEWGVEAGGDLAGVRAGAGGKRRLTE